MSLLYLLKIIGVAVCSILVLQQFGWNNTTVSSFCNLGSKTDCESVINSSLSKLFGVIHLSEFGLIYFLFGLTSVYVSYLNGDSMLRSLLIANLLVLPFSVISIYYQWKILKKWCPLCVSVMIIFWLEFLVLWLPNDFNFYSHENFKDIFFCFAFPLTLWVMIRQPINDTIKLPKLQRKLDTFRRNTKIFNALLSQTPETFIGDFSYEIEHGAEASPIEIVVVSNPLCAPCSFAHLVIDDLIQRYGESLKVKYRFAIPSTDLISIKIARHIFQLCITKGKHTAFTALTEWFLIYQQTNQNNWMKNHPSPACDTQLLDDMLKQHSDWCRESRVRKTPIIFINGKILPEEISISDLKFPIAKLLSA